MLAYVDFTPKLGMNLAMIEFTIPHSYYNDYLLQRLMTESSCTKGKPPGAAKFTKNTLLLVSIAPAPGCYTPESISELVCVVTSFPNTM